MRLWRYIILTLAALIAGTPALPARNTGRWEVVARAEAPAADDDRVEVSVRDGYVYITLGRPATVKVYTILGQTVANGALPAGTSRLRLSARGVYILKAGSHTCRITF